MCTLCKEKSIIHYSAALSQISHRKQESHCAPRLTACTRGHSLPGASGFTETIQSSGTELCRSTLRFSWMGGLERGLCVSRSC
jgi:hypothetical protein